MMKNRTILAALLALPLLAAAASAQDLSSLDVKDQVAKVQQAIKDSGARWEAGETSVSGMSKEEFRNYIGFTPGPVDAQPAPAVEATGLPAALDWRENGGSFVTVPKDQKKCGSCWAFSMTGALESYTLRTQNKPGWDLDLSEQVMLSCSGAGSCNGGRLTAGFLEKSGLP
ncbi:MAG: hypothetical protein HY952_12325, partial [Elusimicrobia bacterium]|nr:hypothetical protein [Elusimicrobiota bacterium]